MKMSNNNKAAWQKEQDAKRLQKQRQAQEKEKNEWQNNRNHMIQKKKEAELKAKQAEEQAPEFLKKLGTMRQKSLQKPKKRPEDEGPTLRDLDDGTDIPPWHRANAPEKPEWVLLLLLAAAREADDDEDDDEEDDGLLVSPKSKLDNLPSEEQTVADHQPEWMKQAKNLKSNPDFFLREKGSGKVRRNSFNAERQGAKRPPQSQTPPAVGKPIRRPVTKASKSAYAGPVSADEKPEWMKGAEALRRKKAEREEAEMSQSTRPASPIPGAPEAQPEWMVKRSKMKEKAKEEENPGQHDKPPKSSQKSASADAQPEWMAQRSKIKDKSKEGEGKSETVGPQDAPKKALQKSASMDEQPEWMAHRSKIKEKSKEEDVNAEVVPRAEDKSPKTPPDSASNGKQPEWMAQRSKIKQKAKEDPPQPDHKMKEDDSGKPAWMSHQLKPRVSVVELRNSKVQEKLDKREPIRQPSIRLTKEELTSNIVMEKLSKRPSLLDRKAIVKSEEMEWMKAKLKPKANVATIAEEVDGKPAWMKQKLKSPVKHSAPKTSLVAKPSGAADAKERPGWLKEMPSRGLVHPDDEKRNQKGGTQERGRAEESGGKIPDWMKEAYKRMPSARSLSVGSAGDPVDSSTITERQPPGLLVKQGSVRRTASMPEGTAIVKDDLVKRPSRRNLATITADPNPKADKPEPSTAMEAEKVTSPVELFPIEKNPTRQGSISSVQSLDEEISEMKSKPQRESTEAKEEGLKFGGSMVDFATSDGESSSSSDSDGKPVVQIDFAPSMNVISAKMESNSSVLPTANPAPSLQPIKRRKSTASMPRKQKEKSRSLSGGSMGSSESSDEMKKKTRETKDKEKKKKGKKVSKKEPKRQNKKDKDKSDKKEKGDKKIKKKEGRDMKNDLPPKQDLSGVSNLLEHAAPTNDPNVAVAAESNDFEPKQEKSEAQVGASKSEQPAVTDAPKTAKKDESKDSESKKGQAEDQVGVSKSAPPAVPKTLQKDESKDSERKKENSEGQMCASKSEQCTLKDVTKTVGKDGSKDKGSKWWAVDPPKKEAPKKEAPKKAWWEKEVPRMSIKDPKSNWASAQGPDGNIYYYNTSTGETTWNKPDGF